MLLWDQRLTMKDGHEEHEGERLKKQRANQNSSARVTADMEINENTRKSN